MSNANLIRAKQAKNDEFYTQYKDIENEVLAYTKYNPDVFRGKTILCPCDDPDKSNFTKYFIDHFKECGLKKLISTCYAGPDNSWGRYFIMSDNGKVDCGLLAGDGDFRSDEVTAFRDEADTIVTNPPFSLFRDFFDWEKEKEFLTVGNLNAVTYSNVFPSLMNNDVWLGNNKNFSFYRADGTISKSMAVRWFTNMIGVNKGKIIELMTMEENVKNSRHKIVRENGYPKYDNYDAIEVPFIDAIPSDYNGMMGVPITFFDYYMPDFIIKGKAENMDLYGLKTKRYETDLRRQFWDLDRDAVLKKGDNYRHTYNRIFTKGNPANFDVLGKSECMDLYGLKTKKYEIDLRRQYGSLDRAAVVKNDTEYKKTYERVFIKATT